MHTNPFSELPEELLKSAYRSGVELAWPRDQAIEAVQAVARHGRKLFGIETWLLSADDPPRPTPLMLDWSADLQTSVTVIACSAISFITDFRYDADDHNSNSRPVYFNLVVE